MFGDVGQLVAVVEEDPLVQLLGPIETDRRIDRMVAADVEVADELVEEETPERLVTPAVAGEERALDDFRQVHQGEHGPVQVGEVATEDVSFLGGEFLGDVDGHERPS